MNRTVVFAIIKRSVLPILVISIISIIWILSTYRNEILNNIFFAIITVFIAYWVQEIIEAGLNWFRESIAIKTKTKLDDAFIPLFSRLSKIIICCIALITILGRFGVNISALITALGVSGLAIALAAQDTIANIIAGFLIMVDRPFIIGDTIKLPTGEKVKVIDISVRRSKFLTEDNAIVIVPNVDLSKSKIINYSSRSDASGRDMFKVQP